MVENEKLFRDRAREWSSFYHATKSSEDLELSKLEPRNKEPPIKMPISSEKVDGQKVFIPPINPQLYPECIN